MVSSLLYVEDVVLLVSSVHDRSACTGVFSCNESQLLLSRRPWCSTVKRSDEAGNESVPQMEELKYRSVVHE